MLSYVEFSPVDIVHNWEQTPKHHFLPSFIFFFCARNEPKQKSHNVISPYETSNILVKSEVSLNYSPKFLDWCFVIIMILFQSLSNVFYFWSINQIVLF